jgi:hypothetical protein
MRIPSEKDLASITKWAGQFDPAVNMHTLLDADMTKANLVR